jgi:hypothetical protein
MVGSFRSVNGLEILDETVWILARFGISYRKRPAANVLKDSSEVMPEEMIPWLVVQALVYATKDACQMQE